MKTSFTPGPWEQRHGQIYNDSGKTHCLIPYYDAENEQQVADAKLIAAAPLLLAAAQKALRDISYYLEEREENYQTDSTYKELEQAISAAME